MSFVAALRFGAGPEKAVAAILLLMSLSSKAYRYFASGAAILDGVDPGILLIEIVVTVLFVVVGLRANRIYILWMAGFQIIALFAHFAKELSDAISPIAYAIMYVGPSYLQIIILALGIWLHHRRVKRLGNYRSWTDFSNPSQETRHPD